MRRLLPYPTPGSTPRAHRPSARPARATPRMPAQDGDFCANAVPGDGPSEAESEQPWNRPLIQQYQEMFRNSTYPPMEYMGRGGATNCDELISCPSHLAVTHARILPRISSSEQPSRMRSRTSVSSIANKQ